MSIQGLKDTNKILSWIVIASAVLSTWCWAIDIPRTRQIVEDWKKIRFGKNLDVELAIQKINQQEKEIDFLRSKIIENDGGIELLNKNIMPSCFIGRSTHE